MSPGEICRCPELILSSLITIQPHLFEPLCTTEARPLIPQVPHPQFHSARGGSTLRSSKFKVIKLTAHCWRAALWPNSHSQDDKGLHSFLSFHLPSPLLIFSVFPACDLPWSGRVVDGCISGPRGEMKEAKIKYPPAHPPERCLWSACCLLSLALRLWDLISFNLMTAP